MEMRMKKERSFHRSELVFDQRKLGELANLHYSMVSYKWMLIQEFFLM